MKSLGRQCFVVSASMLRVWFQEGHCGQSEPTLEIDVVRGSYSNPEFRSPYHLVAEEDEIG